MTTNKLPFGQLALPSSGLQSSLIHTFKFNNTNLAFEGNTIYLFEIDEGQAAEFRQDYVGGNQTDKHGNYRELISKLLQKLSDRAECVPQPNVEAKISRLWLHLAHECNLRCTYCFADGGTYCSHRGLMSSSTARRSVDFLFDGCSDRTVTIVFFGGEPLLNFKVLRSTVEYTERKAKKAGVRARFDIITNLTLMTVEVADFCREHKIGVQVSLDGPREINDCQRVFPDGSGSYDKIIEKLKLSQDRDVPLRGVRATVTDANADVLELFEFLRGIGFSGITMVAVQPDPRTTVKLTHAGLERIKTGYRRIAQKIIEQIESGGQIDLGPLKRYVKRIHNRAWRWSFCDRGLYMVSIAPDGSIFPCHRVVSEPHMQIGDIHHGLIRPLSEFDCMGGIGIEDKPICKACWAKRICGGGCAASAICAHGKATQPDETHCEILKEQAEAALRVYYALSLNCESSKLTAAINS